MTLTNFPGGLSSFGVPVVGAGAELPVGPAYWFVDSTAGSDGFDGSYDTPFATLAQAVSRCSHNKGDVIVLKAGHAETYVAAANTTVSVAGVRIVGLGTGGDRPAFTFGSSTGSAGSSLKVTANNVSVSNIVGISGKNSLTAPFDVTGNSVKLDVEWQDGTYEAQNVIRAVNTVGLDIKLRYKGLIGGSLCHTAVSLANTAEVNIVSDFYGKASTAVVNFVTDPCYGVRISGSMYNASVTNGTKNVVDTATGSTWWADIFDGSNGNAFSGGSGSALAKDDISGVISTLGTGSIATVYTTSRAAANNTGGVSTVYAVAKAVANTVGSGVISNLYTMTKAIANTAGALYPATYFPSLGYKVSVTENVTTATSVDLFTVTGKCLVTMWTGEVTEILGGAGPADYVLRTKTNTAALCAASDIHGAAVGAMWSLSGRANASISCATGTVPKAPIKDTAENGGFGTAHRIVGQANSSLILQAVRTASTTTGKILHNIYYMPMEAGSSIVKI
jgi:hypothetical protein